MSPRILVVGCGITGAAVNRYVTSMFPALRPSYTVWEKSSSLGGRMITNYLDSAPDRDGKHTESHCDMGAQYLTRSSDEAESLIYSLLNDAGIIAPMVDNSVISGMRPEHATKTHYIAPNGLSSVVDYLSKGQVTDPPSVFCYDTALESITVKYCEELKSNVYSAVGSKLGSKVEESFDTIVLSLPTPQLLALEGDIVGMFGTKFREQLSSVVYSSRFAVAFYYHFSSWSALQNVKWSGKYIFDDEIIRYVSIENRKSNFPASKSETEITREGDVSAVSEGHSGSGPSILVHTSVPFGIQHKDTDEKVVYEMILKSLNMIFPSLGEPDSHHIVNWRDSQISKGLSNFGFEGEVNILQQPELSSDASRSGKRKLDDGRSEDIASSGIVVVTGDAFTESNFEGCLRSAKAAAAAIGKHYAQ